MVTRRILLGFALAIMSFGAHATIMLSPGDEIRTSSDNSNFGTWAAIESGYGIDIDDVLSLLYKANVGDSAAPATTEEGPFAASYDTTFTNSPLDPEDALIEWIGGAAIDCLGSDSCFLIVKDGNHQPAQYLFDISGWDGKMDIDLDDFWAVSDDNKGQGAISNVAIWGGGESVPEPSVIALFGLGLLGIGFARRRKHN